jgi:hypothetical protein
MTLFHPDAETEYLVAIDYYSAIGSRLAARFADAVEGAIVRGRSRAPAVQRDCCGNTLVPGCQLPLYDSIQRNQQDGACGKT